MRRRGKIQNLALCALFAALLCLCASVAIPTPGGVITLQTFGVLLALLTLGGRRGAIAIGIYLLLGAVGLPVFSGFQGGIGTLLGTTGGYLWGFGVGALVFWLITALLGEKSRLTGAVLCLIVCYVCGTLWYACVYGTAGSVGLILLQCVLPYLIPDGLKLAAAWALAARLRKLPETPA